MTPPEPDWWERFFSGRNALLWSEIEAGVAPDGWSEDIISWVRIAQRAEHELPVIFPCLEDNGDISWYGRVGSAREVQRLREELQAFVGPSYSSDYDGRPYTLDPNDNVEAALGEGCCATVFRFSPTSESDIQKIRRAIKLYRSLIDRYSPPIVTSVQSFGIIRGEFDRALLASDESEARHKFEQLIATGRLSAENRLYLEVRLLAGLGRWPQIAGDSRLLRALSDLALPPRVLADVIEALYRVHAEPAERESDAIGALHAFREAGINRYGRLFVARRGLTLPRVVKAFLLYELCRQTPDLQRLDALLNLLGDEATSGFCVNLRTLISSIVIDQQAPSDSTHQADSAFEEDDYERALEIYMALPPSLKRLRRMLSCAKVIGDRKTASRVITLIEKQHETDMDCLSKSAGETFEYLKKLLETPGEMSEKWEGEDPRDGWLQWAHWVDVGVDPAEANAVLQEHAVNWDTHSFAKDASQVEELATLMGNADGDASTVFRNAYPELFEAFVSNSKQSVRACKPLLVMLLTNTVLLDGPSLDELELVNQLAIALLEIGLSNGEYNELIADIEDLLSYQASLSTLSWAMDIAEVLSNYACPNFEVRLRFFVKVLDIARRVSHRLLPAHRIALGLLCQDYDLEFPEELSEAGQEDALKEACQGLTNKKVGIYTLTEQAGQRTAAIIKQICPHVSVDLNSDKVCTERLIALAKFADIFVFAWKSSKHAAYYCVKDNRPEGWPLLLPLGKGSSSIVREVVG